MFRFFYPFLFVAAIYCFGCGGVDTDDLLFKDSNDGEYEGAGIVELSSSTVELDTGDRIIVNAEIANIHHDGVLLKIHFGSILNYYRNSSYLKINRRIVKLEPINGGYLTDDDVYLVYEIPRSLLGADNYGELTLQVRGIKTGTTVIGADVDFDDPRISNNIEFNTEDPTFTAESSLSMTID